MHSGILILKRLSMTIDRAFRRTPKGSINVNRVRGLLGLPDVFKGIDLNWHLHVFPYRLHSIVFSGGLGLCAFLFHITASSAAEPIVSLSYGTFQGFNDGNLTKFFGVPFAKAGRFEAPSAPGPFQGVYNATTYGPACPQQALYSPLTSSTPFTPGKYPAISEECLTLDIYKPATSNAESRLPVFVWMYGGGFEVGNSRDLDMTPVVERSILTNEPVVVVAINYRSSAFGFLAGKEVAAAGVANLGLRDQISALEWVKNNIGAFDGDAARVVLGGQSSGATSAALLMLDNQLNSNTLFHGAFMQSGAPVTFPSVSAGQSDYDGLVEANNCTGANDALQCLRQVPFDSFMATVNQTANLFSYSSLELVWRPRVDGIVIPIDPMVSVSLGQFSKAPFMMGNSDDEGTVFAAVLPNITTSDEFVEYVHTYYMPSVSPAQLAEVATLYPNDPTRGSPFGTGTANQLYPEFKRLSAFLGDYVFMVPRRFFLQHASKRQNVWGWLNKRGKLSSPFGAYHISDQSIWFPTGTADTTGMDYLISFINTLDPNGVTKSSWPTWDQPSLSGLTSLLTFSDPDVFNITAEDFRVETLAYLTDMTLEMVEVVRKRV
ncbi:carotenoid ester lipase precursor [Roridomyces roridus]|uniref:Carotenoid ester lipase n=1 Tax=Roridomyces roridus TaxID=1738132 RepID=A0AAD7FNR2_9AGAR|nr:carotenoid ester lipase precursor [Roridomyces roridus]